MAVAQIPFHPVSTVLMTDEKDMGNSPLRCELL